METISDLSFTTLHNANSAWQVMTHNGVKMVPIISDSILRLEISHTLGANWQGALICSPFPVEAGDIFTVTFSAKAKHPFTFSVWLGQQDSPYESLVAEENHFGEKMMTSSWQTFTHRWKALTSEDKARLVFALGQIDNSVELQGIGLQKAAA